MLHRVKLFLIIIAIPIIFSLSGNVSRAQGLPISGSGLDIVASANNPVPGQNVGITVRSYSIDINSSMVTWTVNGKVVQKGLGATTFDVLAPPLGKKTSVGITAVTPDGINVSGSMTISSGSVDLITETNGYVPPFFKGKAPVAYQNKVRLIAIPHIADISGKEYDPKTLVYQWKKNGKVIDDQSGYGKQSITIDGDIVPRGFSISVTAATLDRSVQVAGYTSVSFESPSIAFYVDDPLYGPMYNSAIQDAIRVGNQKETGIIAVPYGFTKTQNGIGNLAFSWLINNIPHQELSENESIILRVPDGASGSSNIALQIRNSNLILQGSSNGFSAIFSSSAVSDDNETP